MTNICFLDGVPLNNKFFKFIQSCLSFWVIGEELLMEFWYYWYNKLPNFLTVIKTWIKFLRYLYRI